MKTDLDRDNFLALLGKLNSEENDEILAAARDINAKMTVAGVSWDDLLVSQGEEKEDRSDFETGGGDQENGEEKGKDENLEPLNEEESQEAETLINAIRNMKVSEATKKELDEYKEDLREGEFEKMDLRYLRALKTRLSD